MICGGRRARYHQSEEKQGEEWEGQRSERKRTTAASHLRLFVLMMKMQHVCRVSWKVVFPVGGGQCWPDLLTSYLFVMEQKEKAAVFGLKDSLEENRQTFLSQNLQMNQHLFNFKHQQWELGSLSTASTVINSHPGHLNKRWSHRGQVDEVDVSPSKRLLDGETSSRKLVNLSFPSDLNNK